MTTVYSFADASDGRIRSSNQTYQTALNGSNIDIDTTTNSFGTFGQATTASGFDSIYQYLCRFPYTLDPDSLVVSAYFRFTGSIIHGSPDRHCEIREFNWGTVINTGDWASPTEINNGTLYGNIREVQNMGNGQIGRAGSDELTDRLRTTGEVSVVLVTNRQRAQNHPGNGNEEYNQFRTADYSGTAWDPALVYTTVPISTLDRYIGAQVQLSDGTHAFLEHNGALYPNNNILVRHHDGTSASTIGTISREAFGSSDGRGAQAGTIVADDDDNLYVIGREGFTRFDLAIFPFLKGSGHSWSAGSSRTASMPSYITAINNIVAAWHDVGQRGTIVAIISHQSGRNSGIEMSYALLNCAVFFEGGGHQNIIRDSGSAFQAGLTNQGRPDDGHNNFQNETGTLMDIVAAPGTNNRGFFTSSDRGHVLGAGDRLYISRYQLASDGSSFVDIDGAQGFFATKDANAKARIIGISTSQFVTAVAAPDPTDGLSIHHRQNTGTSSLFNVLSSYEMADENIPSMPSASVLATSPTWDIVWDASSNFLWIYYLDATDNRRLMRTHIDLSAAEAAQDEHEVATAVGAVGSTNHAIRVHRGAKVGDRVLITVANETSGGGHSSIYIVDRINVAPTQPTLVSEPNYDALNPATFEWSFNDVNADDAQSAYQLQIDRISDGINVFDSGKVLSSTSSHVLTGGTLANEEDYRWRVKTWDQSDEESPYSGYSTFSTTAAGAVTIIDPAVDNPLDQNVSSYLVEWSVTGTVQEEYRVKMFVNATDELLLDTDWILSTATTHLVDDIPSDVEVRFEVQVRSAGVASVPGTRLYTTSYATPPQPIVTLTPEHSMGYVLVGVSNPIPEGDVVQVEVNEILRRRTDISLAYNKIGEVLLDEEFQDYTALSGVQYEYIVRGRAFSGRADSEPGLTTLRIQGVWIHNPKNPEGTVKHYPYGNQSGGKSITVEQQARQYAGRRYPVVDYGESQDDVMSVAIQTIRNDPYYPESGTLLSLIQFSERRQTLMVRDGFGRGVIGSIEGFAEAQAGPDIHTVSFSVRQVDTVAETVEV